MEFSVQQGRVVQANWCASPNCDDRPPGAVPELIVVHNISLPPGQFGGGYVADLFCNRLDTSRHVFFESIGGLEVSAHFLIDRLGAVTQFVNCNQRAWHAGKSAWRGRSACNDFSVGIELEGTDELPYTPMQYRVLTALIRALLDAYPSLSAQHIAGHCDISPGRKTDPGPAFDWQRLRRGLADAGAAA